MTGLIDPHTSAPEHGQGRLPGGIVSDDPRDASAPAPLVTVKRDGSVARIQLNRPHEHNMLTVAMLKELAAAVERLHDDHTPYDAGQAGDAMAAPEGVRVIVLSGHGPSFCRGVDIAEMSRLAGAGDQRAVRAAVEAGRRVCQALSASPAITIAQVHGKVIGAGVCLAAHCDLRISSDTATFCLPELTIGVPALWGGAGPRLAMEVGISRLRELVLTGEVLDAATATGHGLVHRLAPAGRLPEETTTWARRLARRDPTAVRLTKTAFRAAEATHRQGDITATDADLFAYALPAARP
ncbi:enoyl-CoA hydratase/isomerase family protein [Nonomuraea sp. NPDC050404]|uniref:enoyl-CoA hydratase/isomerase family protein n=1 Tax=Nonomuraea sp. NPDC050404 TaxID=3155783 RepID=UPI0033EFBD21